MLVELVSVLVPRISNRWRGELGYLPQILIGFAVLAIIFALNLASQRKLLREVSTALVAANSYVDRLEQISLIDPPTHLFNRRYLDELFNHQLKGLNRSGASVTLLLLEVIPNGEKAMAEDIVIEAAFILKSTFRGTDYLLRYRTDQFLVVLPDTDEQHAQIALSRLIDKVGHWSVSNQKWEMALRLGMGICPPGANLWEKLGQIEEKMLDKSHPEVRTLTPQKQAAYESTELRTNEHSIQ
jgi:diguanylate cyclase (GGDEF)-like protein